MLRITVEILCFSPMWTIDFWPTTWLTCLSKGSNYWLSENFKLGLEKNIWVFLFELMLYIPVNNFSVSHVWVEWMFSSEDKVSCSKMQHSASGGAWTATPWSKVKHSTTQPLQSPHGNMCDEITERLLICLSDNFSCFLFFCRVLIFFKVNFFEKFFQEYHQHTR